MNSEETHTRKKTDNHNKNNYYMEKEQETNQQCLSLNRSEDEGPFVSLSFHYLVSLLVGWM